MAVEQFRARSGTEIIDAAFQLVKSNAAPLLTISAICTVPAVLAELLNPGGGLNGKMPSASYIFFYVLYFIAFMFLQGALIRATSDAYLGRPIDIAESFRASKKTVGTILLTNFVAGLLVALGFVLLIIPGIIVYTWLFLAPVVVVLEGAKLSEALTRSRLLCRDMKLRILGCMLAVVMVFIICGIFAAIILWSGGPAVAGTIRALLNMLLWPLYMAIMTVLYYDARIRKEGYDLELMAQSMSQPPPPTSPEPRAA